MLLQHSWFMFTIVFPDFNSHCQVETTKPKVEPELVPHIERSFFKTYLNKTPKLVDKSLKCNPADLKLTSDLWQCEPHEATCQIAIHPMKERFCSEKNRSTTFEWSCVSVQSSMISTSVVEGTHIWQNMLQPYWTQKMVKEDSSRRKCGRHFFSWPLNKTDSVSCELLKEIF
jgi:hypothetical protein